MGKYLLLDVFTFLSAETARIAPVTPNFGSSVIFDFLIVNCINWIIQSQMRFFLNLSSVSIRQIVYSLNTFSDVSNLYVNMLLLSIHVGFVSLKSWTRSLLLFVVSVTRYVGRVVGRVFRR